MRTYQPWELSSLADSQFRAPTKYSGDLEDDARNIIHLGSLTVEEDDEGAQLPRQQTKIMWHGLLIGNRSVTSETETTFDNKATRKNVNIRGRLRHTSSEPANNIGGNTYRE
jgi:hypothetical protein